MKNVLMGFCLLIVAACVRDYSAGSRVGVVTKLSEKGLIWKSWEGEMNMGGMRMQTDEHGNQSAAVNVFEFNVSPEAVEKVKAAQLSGKPVELVYRQWFIAPLSISNDHVIVDVKSNK